MHAFYPHSHQCFCTRITYLVSANSNEVAPPCHRLHMLIISHYTLCRTPLMNARTTHQCVCTRITCLVSANSSDVAPPCHRPHLLSHTHTHCRTPSMNARTTQAGTSDLWQFISKHPAVNPGRVLKEQHYFTRPWITAAQFVSRYRRFANAGAWVRLTSASWSSSACTEGCVPACISVV